MAQCHMHGQRSSTILPIYKGSGNKHDPNNYRGISIQSCIAKSFYKVLNNRLCLYLEKKGILKEEQNGFRKDRSCQDHIASLYYILENRKLSKLDTYCCFVDFKKAFDSIPRELLWQKLAKYGINGQILRCLQAAYTNVTSSIRIDNELSNSFEINCGLKQGCPLSPTLFNIYINDLIDDLNQEEEGISFGDCKVNALLYADDVVLLGGSPDQLQRLLHTLGQWCSDNYMHINPSKTKIMHIRHPKKVLCNKTISCCGRPIDYTDCYKYLGIIFTEHLSWNKAIESTAISASTAASYLIAKARASGGFMYETYTHLYNTLVLPIIEYGSFLWASNQLLSFPKFKII